MLCGKCAPRFALLVRAIATQAEKHLGIPMPGMTHMQHAQPLLFSHFLLAHAEAFLRDAERFCRGSRPRRCLPDGLRRAGRLRVSARPRSAGARTGFFAHHGQ